MTRASGRKAHSNGAALEKYLENIHFREAVNAGYFLHWAKQNPSYYGKQTRSGVVFMPHKASGADWIVLAHSPPVKEAVRLLVAAFGERFSYMHLGWVAKLVKESIVVPTVEENPNE